MSEKKLLQQTREVLRRKNYSYCTKSTGTKAIKSAIRNQCSVINSQLSVDLDISSQRLAY
jgi:hypothetical protein